MTNNTGFQYTTIDLYVDDSLQQNLKLSASSQKDCIQNRTVQKISDISKNDKTTYIANHISFIKHVFNNSDALQNLPENIYEQEIPKDILEHLNLLYPLDFPNENLYKTTFKEIDQKENNIKSITTNQELLTSINQNCVIIPEYLDNISNFNILIIDFPHITKLIPHVIKSLETKLKTSSQDAGSWCIKQIEIKDDNNKIEFRDLFSNSQTFKSGSKDDNNLLNDCKFVDFNLTTFNINSFDANNILLLHLVHQTCLKTNISKKINIWIFPKKSQILHKFLDKKLPKPNTSYWLNTFFTDIHHKHILKFLNTDNISDQSLVNFYNKAKTTDITYLSKEKREAWNKHIAISKTSPVLIFQNSQKPMLFSDNLLPANNKTVKNDNILNNNIIINELKLETKPKIVLETETIPKAKSETVLETVLETKSETKTETETETEAVLETEYAPLIIPQNNPSHTYIPVLNDTPTNTYYDISFIPKDTDNIYDHQYIQLSMSSNNSEKDNSEIDNSEKNNSEAIQKKILTEQNITFETHLYENINPSPVKINQSITTNSVETNQLITKPVIKSAYDLQNPSPYSSTEYHGPRPFGHIQVCSSFKMIRRGPPK